MYKAFSKPVAYGHSETEDSESDSESLSSQSQPAPPRVKEHKKKSKHPSDTRQKKGSKHEVDETVEEDGAEEEDEDDDSDSDHHVADYEDQDVEEEEEEEEQEEEEEEEELEPRAETEDRKERTGKSERASEKKKKQEKLQKKRRRDKEAGGNSQAKKAKVGAKGEKKAPRPLTPPRAKTGKSNKAAVIRAVAPGTRDTLAEKLAAGGKIPAHETGALSALLALRPVAPPGGDLAARQEALGAGLKSVRYDAQMLPASLPYKSRTLWCDSSLPGRQSRRNWPLGKPAVLDTKPPAKLAAEVAASGFQGSVARVDSSGRLMRGLCVPPRKKAPWAGPAYLLEHDVEVKRQDFAGLRLDDVGHFVVLPWAAPDKKNQDKMFARTSEIHCAATLSVQGDEKGVLVLHSGVTAFLALGFARALQPWLAEIEALGNRRYNQKGQIYGFWVPSVILNVARAYANNSDWLPQGVREEQEGKGSKSRGIGEDGRRSAASAGAALPFKGLADCCRKLLVQEAQLAEVARRQVRDQLRVLERMAKLQEEKMALLEQLSLAERVATTGAMERVATDAVPAGPARAGPEVPSAVAPAPVVSAPVAGEEAVPPAAEFAPLSPEEASENEILAEPK